jgi:hypothetical protein
VLRSNARHLRADEGVQLRRTFRVWSVGSRLSDLFSEGGAFREMWRTDGQALMEMKNGHPVPTTKVHFGYAMASA